MKLIMVVERPTQFEVPLFRHAARDSQHSLRVLFTDPAARESVADPELGRRVEWGGDPLDGYDHAIAPAGDVAGWLAAELASERDLVIVNGYTGAAYQAAARCARRAGSKVALRLDSVPFDEGGLSRRIAKHALFRTVLQRSFDYFFGVGSLTHRYLSQHGVPEERIGRFPYPVDLEGFRQRCAGVDRAALRRQHGIPVDAPVVLAVAKLHPRETPRELLSAWPHVRTAGARLLLVGDGPERAGVETTIRERGLRDVTLTGYVPYARLHEMYALADLFVHAPREERWGVSVGEALACGTPVVASTRVGAAYDLVAPGVTGWIYTAGDAEELAATVDRGLALDRSELAQAVHDTLTPWAPAATWGNLLAAAAWLRQTS